MPSPRQYSDEEQQRLREQFAPIKARYRRWRLILAIIGLCFMIGAILTCLLQPAPSRVFPWMALLWIGAFVAVLRTRGTLICPGCNGGLEQPAAFCPECGSPRLAPRRWFAPVRCNDCGRTLHTQLRRQFHIRACTHCALRIDEQGL